MNDFKYIKYKNNNNKVHKLAIYNYNYLHNKAHKWLKENITSKTIVLTHHAPIIDPDIHSIHTNPDKNMAYCTNLQYLLKNVKTWCWGHTHQPYKNIIDNCVLQSNPMGYYLEKIDEMDKYFTIEIS